MGIGTNIKRLLATRKMTIKELAEKTGIPVATLYSITRRDSQSTKVEYLNAIARALGVGVDQLIDMAILDMFFSNKILANNDAELPDSIGKLPSGEDVGSMYNKLTKEAKEKLLDYLTDLLEQPKYRADNLEPNK